MSALYRIRWCVYDFKRWRSYGHTRKMAFQNALVTWRYTR